MLLNKETKPNLKGTTTRISFDIGIVTVIEWLNATLPTRTGPSHQMHFSVMIRTLEIWVYNNIFFFFCVQIYILQLI